MRVATKNGREFGYMPRVKVTRSRKARGGTDIVGLFGPSIGYETAEEVVSRIREGSARYYVREGSWEADVRVVDHGGGVRLVSTNDVFSRNNLANLPDC